jgi:hypothetical protein
VGLPSLVFQFRVLLHIILFWPWVVNLFPTALAAIHYHELHNEESLWMMKRLSMADGGKPDAASRSKAVYCGQRANLPI